MSNPSIKIHNVETGEVIEREMNAEELAAYQKNLDNLEAEKIAQQKAQSEKAFLLEKLGITEEEAKLLLS